MADFTFYPDVKKLVELGWVKLASARKQTCYERDLLLSLEGDASRKLHRAILCRAYGGEQWAITARSTDILAGEKVRAIQRPESHYRAPAELTQWPSDNAVPEASEHAKKNAATIEAIWRLIEPQAARRHGVIVIAGATGSRKTTYAREFARLYLSQLVRTASDKAGWPHVVTCEDPIESWFASSPAQANASGFDYTPRQKGVDVTSLEEAVTDALRQKPALFYVNEIRHDPDWATLLYFAGTGHFAMTTTHAGSLIEAFERVIVAAKADTPAKRSEIGTRIVAIIHLKWINGALIPALWVESSRGRTALTQEGLGSLLPTDEGGSCYGRAYFAKQLKLDDAVSKEAVIADLRGE